MTGGSGFPAEHELFVLADNKKQAARRAERRLLRKGLVPLFGAVEVAHDKLSAVKRLVVQALEEAKHGAQLQYEPREPCTFVLSTPLKNWHISTKNLPSVGEVEGVLGRCVTRCGCTVEYSTLMSSLEVVRRQPLLCEECFKP